MRPNVAILSALLPDEFREGYVNDMNKFLEESLRYHREKLRCGVCPELINSGEELVRYQGSNLHPTCFSKEYFAEREKMEGYAREYFDLVLARIVLKS